MEDFYQEIEHIPIVWNKRQLFAPAFYQDIMSMTVFMLAPSEKLKELLPSKRLRPYRITPWHSVLVIMPLEYRQSDIGPYNEIIFGIPVTLDRDTPMFTGILRGMPDVPQVYIHQMPVTTEIALELGVELLGFPKFIADISFFEEEGWISCKMESEAQHILTIRGRKLPLKQFPRSRMNPIGYRKGYLLRCEWIDSQREIGISKRAEDVKLELGEHRVGKELRELNLGKVLEYRFCPKARGILAQVFESYAA